MKIRCLKCGTEFAVGAGAATIEPGVVACPTCGARYRKGPPGSTLAGLRATTIKDAGDVRSGSPQASAPAADRPSESFESRGLTTPIGALPGAFPGAPHTAPDGVREREPETEATFQHDALVAHRYRIRRFIARGGMGEVYEALDQELNVAVALKTLRPMAADELGSYERLKREIQLARRVTHPNVCRIFDVGHHEGLTRQIAFMTMELLAGETLASRLRREGPMGTEEALPILRQVAAALQAAHRVDVIHRDFKSENVFLVPDPAEDCGVRAVVADFGIARATEDNAARLTATGGVIGTPAYMAPEQLDGGEVTRAADIYAFGLVTYEMVTGHLPFMSDTAIATAVKRLTTAPEPPRQFAPDLDERWESVILRCLERYPSGRFASAAQAVAALEAGAPAVVPAAVPSPAGPDLPQRKPEPGVARIAAAAPPRERGKRWALAALGLVLVAAVSTAVLRVRGRQETEQLLTGPVAPRKAVAVVGFKNGTGRPDATWLSTALSEMLTTELGAGNRLRVVPGENVVRAKLDLGLADTGELDGGSRAKLRSLLGADYLVLGTYTALGTGETGKVRLDLRMVDATLGEVLTSYGEDVTEAQLFEVVRRAGEVLRERLGVDRTGGTGDTGFWSAKTWTPEASRLYAEGVAQLRGFEPRAARETLERAVAADPESAAAHAALAEAWNALGYQAQARGEARRAFELASGASAEERMAIEGRYRELMGDSARAAAIYGELFAAAPDDLETGLRLAAANTAAGKASEALATLTALRALPAPASDDPRIALAESVAAGALSDFRRQRTAAATAAAGAAQSGARLLAARARMAEGWALRNLGELAAAEAASGEAAAMFAAAGDRAGEADALSELGVVRYERGDLPGARARYAEALGVYREVGDQAGAARVLNNAAVLARQEGNLAGARAQYESALQICRETGDKGGAAASLSNLGTILTQEGDLAAAKGMFEESLGLRRETQDQSGIAAGQASLGVLLRRQGALGEARTQLEAALASRRQSGQKLAASATLSNLGRVLLDQGELVGAAGHFAEALALSREVGSKSGEAHALAGQGEVALAGGDLAAARAHLEQALALRAAIGEKINAAETGYQLAIVLFEEGNAPAAVAAATASRAELAALGAADSRLLGAALLARAQMAAGNAAAARATAAELRAAAATSQSPLVRITCAITDAETLPPSERTRAEADLVAARRQAEALGLIGLAFEARLAAARAANGAGRSDLAALATEAGGKGYALIAAKARRASARPA